MSCVIIPTFNESERISNLIDKVKKYSDKIIVVDDGSTDDTFNKIKNKDIIFLPLGRNEGKGYAMRLGYSGAIFYTDKENIIIMDADGQHRPEDIPKFMDALKTNDIVFGYRKFNKYMPLLFRVGNWGLNLIMSVLFKRFKDSLCGFVAFKKEKFKDIIWKSNRYNVELEIKINTIRNKLKYKEIPIKTIYNDKNKGTGIMDGIKMAIFMLWSRLKWNRG